MCKVLKSLVPVLLVAVLQTATGRADEPENVPIDKLPTEVAEALKKKYPDAELVEAEKYKEDGKVHYDVTIKFKKQELEVTLTPAGKIVQVLKDIEVQDVPKVVLDGIEKKYPKSTVKGASEISKDDKVAEYQLEILTKKKKALDVTFDKDGKFVDEEPAEVAEAPKDKKDKKDK